MPDATTAYLSDIAVNVGGADLDPSIYNNLTYLEVESRLDFPARAILEFADPGFTLLNGTKFDIGKPMKIRMKASDVSFHELFNGEVIALEPDLDAKGMASIRVEGTTKAHRLYDGLKTMSWSNIKDSDIFSQLAGQNGLSADVDATSEVYEHVTQAVQSDWDFIRERAGRIGYLVFVDGSKLCVKRPDYTSSASVALAWGDNLHRFRPRATAASQPANVQVNYWDMKQKRQGSGRAGEGEGAPTAGIGANTVATAFFRSSPAQLARWPASSAADAEQIARGTKTALWSGLIQAEGVCEGTPTMLAGTKATVSGVGTKFNGDYVLSHVRHIRDEDGYRTEFEVRGLRTESMSDLVSGGVGGGAPAEQSRWYGVVPGVVSDNQDPENLGRVKVSMPWLGENYVSNWARIAVPMAGSSGKGVFFAPEINDEVLVAFEHGEINVPYVVGFLYNGKDPIPDGTVVSGKVERRVLISTKGHTVALVDKDGSESIEIIDHTGKNLIKIESGSGLITVEGTDIQLKASNSIKLDAVNVEVTASGNFKVNASANVDIVANAQVNVQASGPVAVKGAIINLN